MTKHRALKLMMGIGLDRNEANLYLNRYLSLPNSVKLLDVLINRGCTFDSFTVTEKDIIKACQ